MSTISFTFLKYFQNWQPYPCYYLPDHMCSIQASNLCVCVSFSLYLSLFDLVKSKFNGRSSQSKKFRFSSALMRIHTLFIWVQLRFMLFLKRVINQFLWKPHDDNGGDTHSRLATHLRQTHTHYYIFVFFGIRGRFSNYVLFNE